MSYQADLALRGGIAFLPGMGLQTCDILITDGKITAIADTGAGAARDNVDVTGLTVLPGAVDAHIHLGHGMD
ncbi:MAG: dihydroorotase, partial [Rhodobiaceae bacterium]